MENELFPKHVKPKPVAIRTFRDGREVCNLLIKEGRDEYERRKREMWERQGKVCCLSKHIDSCPGRLAWADTVFEHQDGRGHGGGKRDDRIRKPDKNGEIRPYNGAAHAICNMLKASRPIDYTDFYCVP